MLEQIIQMGIKPAHVASTGCSSVHKKQSALRIIFPSQGPVHRFHGFLLHLAAVDGAVAHRRELPFLINHVRNRIGEFIAFHTIQNHVGNQDFSLHIASAGLRLDDTQKHVVVAFRIIRKCLRRLRILLGKSLHLRKPSK